MIENVQQVEYSSRYRQSLLSLLDKTPHKAAIWRWQFEENPFGRGFSPVIFTDQNDCVIGFNGVMAVEALDRGEPIDALWSCDFHVASQWRGQGLGSQIKRALNSKADLIMALGVSDQACKVLAHLGWRRYPNIYSYRLVRRWNSWRNVIYRLMQILNRLAGLQKKSSSHFTLTANSQLPSAQEVDDLWQASKSGFRKVVARNSVYLNWKYQQHPLARYAFVSARSRAGQLAGVLVVRYHKGMLRIVDYCGPAKDRQLKRALIRFCRKHWHHARQITATTSDDELGHCLYNEGFFRPRTKPRFFIRPAGLKSGGDEHKNDWFIMAGDSDGELLAAAADQVAGESVEWPVCVNDGRPRA